ncbi:Multidrug resistance-associated protein 4-like [Oopsacas minuta]|uniref:Multidrug resistance-associated protein 4-like n=1 Tax=Oopsacas minuta TaxID=111878 RepID=A0AAV7JS02_9METZ|nr:Multidrug resistance-associated protein 4-like [Oopsacas minuta]
MSLINELSGMSSHINITGVIFYTSQQPWILPGTIRDNILFNKHFDSCRYQRVLQVSSLTDDLQLFSEGDVTLIGERGVTLSGGQKARVALARTIYQEAAIYLLDDPLSAVTQMWVERYYYNWI